VCAEKSEMEFLEKKRKNNNQTFGHFLGLSNNENNKTFRVCFIRERERNTKVKKNYFQLHSWPGNPGK
jgi:hypothetical protein